MVKWARTGLTALLLAGWYFVSSPAVAVEVGGNITNDTTWTAAEKIIVTGDVFVEV